MAWTTPSSQTTGTLVTASWVNTYLVDNLIYLKSIADQVDGLRIVSKSANETVNNSTTVQNDDHLAFSVAASTRYGILMQLWISAATSGSTMDLKGGWSLPSGASIIYAPLYAEISSGITTAFQYSATATQIAELATSASQLVHFQGIISVSSTAGTATFQWAQQTATAQDLILLAGSNIKVFEL